jgi:cardiolipin synthase
MRPMRPFWLLLLAFPLFLSACATVPNAKQLSVAPGAGPPAVETAAGHMSHAQGEKAMEKTARYPGDDEALQKQVAVEGQVAGSPLVAGNRLTLIEDGRPTYDAIEQAILSAKTNISMETYTIEGDAIGTAIADALIEKRRQGVTVQLIYDSFGSHDTPQAFWDRLRAEGVQVLEYNPLNPAKVRVAYEPNDRDHRKCLIVDGRLAVMGGVNVSEIYLYGGSEPNSTDRWWVPWHDTDIAVEGPVVAQYQRFFLDVWAAQKGDALPAVEFFPKLTPAGDSYVRAVPGTPQMGDPQIYVALLSAIRRAERNVWLTAAYFDPPEEARHVLEDAARRGVDVRLSVGGESDSQLTLAAGRSRYDELLKAGVKISERRDVFLHGKTGTIDGVWSIVGSANLDTRSVVWNNELSTIVLGRKFAREMEDQFERGWASGTTIERDTWENRPFVDRVTDWSARALDGLL